MFTFGIQTNPEVLGKIYTLLWWDSTVNFCKLDKANEAAFQAEPRHLWLHQKGNKKQVNQTDSMQAEQGKEMGFRFAEMIPPDRD